MQAMIRIAALHYRDARQFNQLFPDSPRATDPAIAVNQGPDQIQLRFLDDLTAKYGRWTLLGIAFPVPRGQCSSALPYATPARILSIRAQSGQKRNASVDRVRNAGLNFDSCE
jgi:hypothetical protein